MSRCNLLLQVDGDSSLESAGDLIFPWFTSLQTDQSEVVLRSLLPVNKACLELLLMMRWNISKANNRKNPGSFPCCVICITLPQNDRKQAGWVLTGECMGSQNLTGKLAFSLEEECSSQLTSERCISKKWSATSPDHSNSPWNQQVSDHSPNYKQIWRDDTK